MNKCLIQALSEHASTSEESINILSVAIYRNQALYHELRESHNLCDFGATLPCGLINRQSPTTLRPLKKNIYRSLIKGKIRVREERRIRGFDSVAGV